MQQVFHVSLTMLLSGVFYYYHHLHNSTHFSLRGGSGLCECGGKFCTGGYAAKISLELAHLTRLAGHSSRKILASVGV